MSEQHYRQSLLSSALILSGKIGQEREKQRAAALPRCSREIDPTFHDFSFLPQDIQIEVFKYLSFVDLQSVFVSSKHYASLPIKNNMLWQRVAEFCMEDKRDFIELFSGMHSWYSRLKGGRNAYFVISPSRMLRGYGESMQESDWVGKFGLHYHRKDERFLPEGCPWVKVNLNCFYGQRNPHIAVSEAKLVADGKFYEKLLELHKVTAEEMLLDQWEYDILAKREYRRLADKLHDALCELEERVFSVPYDVWYISDEK